MIQMERAVKIRRRYLVGKESIKSLSRELGISRNTVRRIIWNERVGEEYKREEQPLPKLGKHKDQLEMWLEEDRKLPKKQRCNARKLYERLQEKGYEGAYDSVQRFAKSWHLNKGKTAGQAYVPLYFSPGEAYQFDWSEEVAEIGGIVQTVKAAQFRLCFSRRFIVITYPRETQEMMFDAHDKAFVFFDGLPLHGIYDNLKTAVDTVYR